MVVMKFELVYDVKFHATSFDYLSTFSFVLAFGVLGNYVHLLRDLLQKTLAFSDMRQDRTVTLRCMKKISIGNSDISFSFLETTYASCSLTSILT